jgi:hypothetical protein
MLDPNLRRSSKILAVLITIVLVVLLFGISVEILGLATHHLPNAGQLVWRMPLIFYLWAVWSVRRAVVAIGRGQGHDAAIAQLIGRVGLALFLGGIATVFVAPWLAAWINGRGSFAYYDVSAITVGVVGAALVLVARLLGQAAVMRRELDEII